MNKGDLGKGESEGRHMQKWALIDGGRLRESQEEERVCVDLNFIT